jgi:UDP-glucose:(heptosyl)LPS alpha-1,3-glucosyltransferase
MKLGLVRRGYSPTGGAEAYLLRLAAELARRGHELVLFSDVAWPDSALAAHHLQIERAVIEARTPRRFADVVEKARADYALDLLFSLERVWSCDLYRAGDGVHAAWLERRARLEPAWQDWLRQINPKHRQILDLERALFTGGARRIITNSELIQHEITDYYGTPAERMTVIHNGLPHHSIAPGARAEVRAELELAETDDVAIFVGSGWERKGLRFAVEAVRQMPGVTLLVAGKGSPRGLDADQRIRFLGPRNDVPRLLAAADVFVLPTIYEPFSNACLEALAAGLPVITTEANGFAEIMAAGTDGEVLGDPSDIPALVAAIERWRDPARRAAVRHRLLALAARFSIEENVEQTLAVIEELQTQNN